MISLHGLSKEKTIAPEVSCFLVCTYKPETNGNKKQTLKATIPEQEGLLSRNVLFECLSVK